MRAVSSWGRLSREMHATVDLGERARIAPTVQTCPKPALAGGNGRSYGDVGLNPGGTLLTTGNLDRFIEFDEQRGEIECEAGVLLKDIIDLALPRGWFPPVAPGTQLVTVGGAIANDVHGKSHGRSGSFGNTVKRLTLVRTDGTTIECSAEHNADWFAATVGGMGLTGVISSARLRLQPVAGPWIDAETLYFDSLQDFFALSASAEKECEYSAAWIDCVRHPRDLVRGFFFRGNHSSDETPAPRSRSTLFPFTPPLSLVNGISVRVFNELYCFAKRAGARRKREHCAHFLFPLDNIRGWNKVYGPRGFYQYQCVVPATTQLDATQELLDAIARSGSGSFLTVLKTFGDVPPRGMLSFPMAGTTLAVDFPNHGAATLALFDTLNSVVLAAGGRLYAAKDAAMPRAMFMAGYPRLAEFLPFRDPGISSAMSRRLLGV